MNANGSLPRVVLRTRALEMEYGQGAGRVRALDAVELEVAPGETLAVMGPERLRKIDPAAPAGGLERPSAGEVWLAEDRIDQLSEKALARLRRHAIGFVFQAFHLMDELTAVENAGCPRCWPALAARARRRAEELLDQVGLTDRAEHLPTALSGWRAPAGRDRTRAQQRAAGRPRRRANRQPRQRRNAGRALAPRQPAFGRADAADRHPRRPGRGHRRPADLHARRRVRRGDQADARNQRPAQRAGRAGGLTWWAAFARLAVSRRVTCAGARPRPRSCCWRSWGPRPP